MKNSGWKRSARKKIFWLIMPINGVILVVLGLLWVFSSRDYITANVLTSHRLALAAMRQTSDVILEDFDQTIDTITQDEDVINLAATPDLKDYSRNRRVILLLNSMAEQGYKTGISIYIPWIESVFSSDMNIYPISDSGMESVVNDYRQERRMLNAYGNGLYEKSRIMLAEGGKTYVIRDFPRYDSVMYTVAVEIDLRTMMEDMISKAVSENETVLIADSRGIVLMSSDHAKVGEEYDLKTLERGLEEQYVQTSKGELFVEKSTYSGLFFIIQSSDSMESWYQRTMTTSFILLLFMAALQFVCAGMAATLVFRPIEKLVNMVLNSRSSSISELEENGMQLGYLNAVSKQLIEHQSTTGKAVSMLSQMLISRLVLAAYANEEMQDGELEEIKGFLGIAGKTPKKYGLLLVRITGGDTTFLSREQDGVLLELSIRSIVENELSGRDFDFYYVNADKDTSLVIFAETSQADSGDDVDEAARSIRESLDEAFTGKIILIYERTDYSVEELGPAVKRLKIAASSQEHGMGEKREGFENQEQSNKLMENLQGMQNRIYTALFSTLNKRDTSVVRALLADINRSSQMAKTEVRMAMYIFAQAMEDYAAKEKPGEKAGALLVREGKKLESMLDEGCKIQAVLCRAELAADTAVRLITVEAVSGQSRTMSAALEYIDTHYAQKDFSLSSTAESIGCSSGHLSRRFKESMGQGFVNYVNRYKIERAKYLLLDTELPVSEISEQVGFTTQQHFMRTFKLISDYTPGSFRLNFKQ